MKKIKEWIIVLYWFPDLAKAGWRLHNGGFFVFRDSSVGFLRFLWAVKIEADEDLEKMAKASEMVQVILQKAMEEIEMRKRRGDWV